MDGGDVEYMVVNPIAWVRVELATGRAGGQEENLCSLDIHMCMFVFEASRCCCISR